MKKKLLCNDDRLLYALSRLFRIMKLTTFLILISLISVHAKVFSQTGSLNIKVSDTTVKDILREIEDQSDYFFLYNDQQVDVQRKVDLEVTNKSIESVLEELFESSDVNYTIKERQIVLYNKQNQPKPNKKPEAFQQAIKSVNGTVTDASGGPLPGVTVAVKGTTNGTITDFDGKYSLGNLPANATLVFSFVGMKPQEVLVSRGVINVTMEEETIGLDEVVAIGYGTVKKRDITGSVASVKGDDLQAIPVATAAEAITGRMAGVQVTATDGAPDAEIRIRVRGGGSITQDNTPLFIVDGFPVSTISDIPPSDIESIDVLKDASSTAIYGARGANGVIIVTTKSGKEGKVSVSYNAYYGLKKIAKTMDVLEPEDYAKWQYEYALLDKGADDLTSYTDYFGEFQDIDLYKGVPGNNWQKQIYGRTGNIFSNDLTITGGSDKMKYSFSYAHLDEKSIMLRSGFERDNFSLKLNHKPNEKIDLNYSVRYSDTDINGSGANEQNETSSADARLRHSVIYTPIPLNGLESDIDEEIASSELVDPLVATADNDRTQSRRSLDMGASAAWEIIDNLRIKSEFGLRNYYYNDSRFYGLSTYFSREQAGEYTGQPAVRLVDRKTQTIRNTNTINYDFKDLLNNEDHSLSVLMGQETIKTEEIETTSEVVGFPTLFTSDQAFKLTSQGSAATVDNFFKPDRTLLSFFGRVNYNFQSKYILSATFRADGSSKFAKGNRWGYFPSAAFAWRVSGEDFMSGTENWLDDLKVRLSYGSAGNNNIPSNQIVQSFQSSSQEGRINNVSNYWSPSSNLANPDLKWETTYTRNVGLDYALLGSRLSGSVEAYFNTTKDLLIEFPVSGIGYSSQYRNMGETENKGIEVAINWIAVDKKDWGLNFGFNIGFNKNKIKSLGIMQDFGASSSWASTEINNDFWIYKGGSVGKMQGYLSDGRYEVSDFQGYDEEAEQWILKQDVADNSAVIGEVRPGSMKLKDIDGDGFVTLEKDLQIIGDANPLCTGGFNLGARAFGFDLSAVFSYSIGNDIYNANKIQYTSTSKYQYRNMIDMMGEGNRWVNVNFDTGELINDPQALEQMNANTTMWSPYMARHVFSDWAVEDGSFLRLNTLTLGYTIPKALLQKVKLNNLRFYATCYNVFIITDYSGFDPEVSTRRKTALTPGVDYSPYPKSRQITFGLNLNF
ncbi:TonB-linked SusC/RagA family outer membrane protein [Mangrovibacterium marinum]|uniref:TonB-linked SusC/RagA family outer membrane protein n=2 Tax=Mangrovibacterium marinum TaxID=1639118 RepID=A0A2T5BT64_9BACT|nr:TonB-linked SusC/RagA family outer membrane protein [Mangrovibacterium marinum]